MDTLTDVQETEQLSFADRLRLIIPKLPDSDDKVFGLIFFLYAALPLVFYPFLRDGFETLKFSLFLFGCGVIFVVLVLNKQVNLRHNRIFTGLLIMFAGFTILSTIFSLDPWLSVIGLTGRGSNSFLFLFFWSIFTWLTLSKLTVQRLEFLLKTVFLTGFLIALYSLLQHAGIGYYSGLKVETRVLVPSLLGNPNFNAMYLTPLVVLGLWLFSKSSSLKQQLYYGVTTIVIIWGLIDTVSRAAVLGLLISLLVVGTALLLKRLNKKLIISIGLAVALTVSLGYIYFQTYRPDNLTQSVSGVEQNQEYRYAVWSMATEVVTEHPWTGTGFANFYLEFKDRGWSVFSAGERFDDPHNIFLLLATTGGLPLALVFTALVFYACWVSFRRYYLANNQLSLVLLGSTIGLIFAMSFNPIVVACWLLLGLLLATQVFPVSLSKEYILIYRTKTFIALLGVIALGLGLTYFTGELLTNQSRLDFASGNYEQSLKKAKTALLLNPVNGDATRYVLDSRIKLNQDPTLTEELLLKTLAQHPNSSSAHANTASVYYELWKQTNDQSYLGKMDEHIRTALKLEPGYSALYSQLAYLEFKAGNREQALHYGRLALTYNPDQFYGWVLLAKLYYDLGQKPQFLYSYEKAFYYSQDNLVLKKSLQDYKALENIQEIPFPVVFPEPTN